jgi:AcrR family transcriptional regulator
MPKVTDEHKAARRRQILDAAARCFARDGFHRTSMQDIVGESGISAGLVYRYFTGKDDMISAIVTEWHDQRQAALAQETTADTYLDLLRAVGDPAARERMRLGVQIWAEAIRSPGIAEVARRTIDEPRATVAELLDQAGEPNPDGLARVLIAIYQGLQLQTAWDDKVDNAAYVDAVQELLRSRSSTSGGGQPSTR